MKFQRRLLVLPFLVLLFFGCGKKERKYPWDPDRNPPEVTVTPTGFVNGQETKNDTVRFNWIGNSPISEYRYCLNGASWSAWSDVVIDTKYVLDDGSYLFQVMTRYKETTVTTVDSISFRVRAIDTNGIVVYPRRIIADSSVARFSLRSEMLTSCKGLTVNFRALDTNVIISRVPASDSLVPADNYNTSFFFVSGPGNSLFNDSNCINFMIKNPMPGTLKLEITECHAFDSLGNDIPVLKQRGGEVLFK